MEEIMRWHDKLGDVSCSMDLSRVYSQRFCSYVYKYVCIISLVGINPIIPKDTWIKGHYSLHMSLGFFTYDFW
jgi:hypothetical protein